MGFLSLYRMSEWIRKGRLLNLGLKVASVALLLTPLLGGCGEEEGWDEHTFKPHGSIGIPWGASWDKIWLWWSDELYFFDGENFTKLGILSGMRAPDNSPLKPPMWGTSNADIWIGRRHHINGTKWTDTGISLDGAIDMWASSFDNYFLLAKDGLHRYDGKNWKGPEAAPFCDLTKTNGCWGKFIQGTGPTDVFVVGERNEIYRFDGKSWKIFPSPVPSSFKFSRFDGLCAFSPDEVYATAGIILKYNGVKWSRISSSFGGSNPTTCRERRLHVLSITNNLYTLLELNEDGIWSVAFQRENYVLFRAFCAGDSLVLLGYKKMMNALEFSLWIWH